MNKGNYIFLYFLFLFQQICTDEFTSLVIKNIKTPHNYSLEREFISTFSRTQIPVFTLQQKYPSKKIATFQLPPTLKPNEYPQFSPNGNFLLILNAPWSLFYEENPTTYEWNLFDIKTERTIKTFPQNSNPRFKDNNTITDKNFNTYTIPTETQGFFGRFTNFFKNLFVTQPEKAPTSFTQRPIITTTPVIPIQQQPITPTFQTPLPTYIQPTITPEPQEIYEPPATIPAHPPVQITEKSIIPFTPNFLLKTFRFLDETSHQTTTQQDILLNKYISMIGKYTSKYPNKIKLLLPAQTTVIDITYDKARELLKQINELSSFMQGEQNIETINSPEMIRDLGQKVGMLCSIILALTPEKQKLILHEIIILIQKYEKLYNSIIAQLQQQNIATSTVAIQAYNLIKQIESNSIALQNNTITSLEGIKNIDQLSKKLDILYVQLSPLIQKHIIVLQKNIINTYISTYRTALKNNIETNWQRYGAHSIKIASLLCTAGITSTLITILSQHFQMIMGIPTSLDTNLLINNASIAILDTVINALHKEKYHESSTAIIAGTGETLITEMAITPYVQQTTKTYTIQAPSLMGPIQGTLSWEAFEIICTLINQQGGINTIIKKINFKNLFLRPIQPSHNELTTFLLPKIQTLVKNEQIAFVMTDIGWKVFISALIGNGIYMAGIGHTENLTMPEALYYASLKGIKTGFIASFFKKTKKTEALMTIPSTLALPPAPMVNSLLQGTDIAIDPEKIMPDLLTTTAEVATDFVFDESTGFTSMLQTTVSNAKEALKSYWTDFYDFYSIMTQGFPEVNPPEEEAI